MYKLVKYILICFLAVYCCTTYASCRKTGDDAIDISPGDFQVNRDAPIGSIIKELHLKNTGVTYESCDQSGGNLYVLMTYNGAIPSAITHVYNTNVPGVGVSVFFDMHGGAYFDKPSSYISGDYGDYYLQHDIDVKFYKTGEVTSGELMSGQVGYLYGDDGLPSLTVNINKSSNITQIACNIINQQLTFAMGNISADQFTNLGMVSRETSTQNLGMSCDAGANINVTLNGTQNPDSSDPSILALSSGTNVATGVGVQLLYGDKPLELNKMLNLKTSAGGQETFPITARYIQTKDKVTAGSANATATLNITYQ